MFSSQRTLHPQDENHCSRVKPLEDGVLSDCEMSFWYGAGNWILFLCKNSNYHFAAKSFHQSPKMTLQLDTVQRVRDCGTLSIKWETFIKILFSFLRELCGRGGGKAVEPGITGDGHRHIWWESQESKRQHNCCHNFGLRIFLGHFNL